MIEALAVDISLHKTRLRRVARAARDAQPDQDSASLLACERLMALPEYRNARTAAWYLDARSELRTRGHVARELGGPRRIVIPYVIGRGLGLWRLGTLDELSPGRFGILEPAPERQADPQRQVTPQELDLVVVPGLGFDRRGNRLGAGCGYYDRLLARLRPDTRRIGLCYESQLLDRIPAENHDIPLDLVVTQTAIYRP
jgi:5-formyltetrahydrofolate cyclo-ligase